MTKKENSKQYDLEDRTLEFAKQIFLTNSIEKRKSCITCSKCSQLMKEGRSTGCAIRDHEYKNRNSN